MHMMFVDESGDPGYPEKGNWTGWGGTKLFVRVGLIIHGLKWKAWNERLVSFKKGRKTFVGWPQNQRQQLLKDLSFLITVIRLKDVENQLVMRMTCFILGCCFCNQLNQRHLLENVHAQNL